MQWEQFRKFIEKWGPFVVGLLGISGAFQTFIALNLPERLTVTAIATLSFCLGLNRTLAPWIKPPTRQSSPPEPFSKRKFIIAVVAQFFICICVVLFADWFLIGRLTFQLDQTKVANRTIALLIAPYPGVESVVVELPPFNEARCDSIDRTPNSITHLNSVMQDWNGPMPTLLIDDFVYPQREEIACEGDRAVENLEIKPSAIVVYSKRQLWWWRFWSALAGGVIWVIVSGLLWRLSR